MRRPPHTIRVRCAASADRKYRGLLDEHVSGEVVSVLLPMNKSTARKSFAAETDLKHVLGVVDHVKEQVKW